MNRFLIILYIYSLAFFLVLLLFPLFIFVWALTFIYDKRLFLLHRFSCFWALMHYHLNPFWKIKIVGRENINDNVPSVLIANHISYEDILALYSIRKHFKWVSKKENVLIPFFGWVMFFNRYIIVDRNNKRSIRKMISDAGKNIHRGNSVLIFPEGTRSINGNMQRFKEGAFKIALENKASVIPILVSGTEGAEEEKKGMINGRHTVNVDISEPVLYEHFKDKNSKELAVYFRNYLDKMQKMKNNS